MKIEYLKAKNFLCIGEEPLEINFNELGNIVMIQGKNLDYHDAAESQDFSEKEDEFHSNATGKSTIAECIVYGLYGDTIREKVNHTQAINNVNKKGLYVEIIFSVDGKRYRIVRTRKPDSVRLWQDGPPWIDAGPGITNHNEVTAGGQPATNTKIEKEIIKMSHKAFVNIVCFGQHNNYNFLECDAKDQREIAESLLSLGVFKQYGERAKDELKQMKADHKELNAVYEQILSNERDLGRRIEQLTQKSESWKKETESAIIAAKSQQAKIEQELAVTDAGPQLLAYEKSQKELEELNKLLPLKLDNERQLESSLTQANEAFDKIREKVHEASLEKKSLHQELVGLTKEKQRSLEALAKLDQLDDGAKCPHCYGVIDKQHYKHVATLHTNTIDSVKSKIELIEQKIKVQEAESNKWSASLSKINELKETASTKLRQLSGDIRSMRSKANDLGKLKMPDLSSKEMVLREKIKNLDSQIETFQSQLAEGGPYKEIIQTAKEDLVAAIENRNSHKSKMDAIEEEMPYYAWWVKGFDDIRSYLIERITPSLNARIATWLQCLLNGKIKVTFDKHLEVNIKSTTGDEIAYYAACGSERQRINLAISQAFAYVTMLSSGRFPSLVFLDEVSDSIDQRGIRSIYNMICELSSEKQVFVITHNIHLKQMLQGADTITMVRKDGCSTRS